MRFAREMAFYSAYHQEKRNVYIHIFGVPLISFSFLVVASWLSLSIGGYDISLAMVLTIGVLLYYFSLDVPFALVATLIFGGILFAADFIANAYPAWIGWSIFGAGQIIGWGTQIYGHLVFEKSRPAFLDNLFQALVSAPLFVIADVFFEFEIRKELSEQVKDQLKERGVYKKEFDMA